MARDKARYSATNTELPLSRRKLIQLLGAGTVAGVAGCSDDGSDGSGDGDDGGSTPTDTAAPTDTMGSTDTPEPTEKPHAENPRDDTFTWINSYSKERHGYNPYNPTEGVIRESALLTERLARYDVAENQWIAKAADNWNIGEEEATLTLSEDYYWSNGDQITAEDYFTQVSLQVFDSTPNVLITDAEVLEGGPGGTIRYELAGGTNPAITKRNILDYEVFLNDPAFKDFAERLRSTDDKEKRQEIEAEMEEFSYKPKAIGGDHDPEEILASGVFKMTEMTNKRIVFEPNEHHPVGGSLNFDVELRWTKDEGAEKPMMKSNTTDVSVNQLSPQFLDTLPSNWKTVDYPAFGGNSIDFLLDHETYAKRKVRQALNYMIDQEQVGKANPTPATAVEYQNGMADFISEAWLSDDMLENLTHYEQDFDKAAELLREADFTKEGGTWYKPNGEEFKFQVELPAGNTNRIKETEVATQHCKDFGIESNIKISESSTYWSTYRSGDWPSGVKFWAFGDRGRPHPAFDYEYVHIGGDRDKEETPWNHQPWKVKVPYPIGDPDGDLKEVDFHEKIRSLNTVQDPDKEKSIVAECAWIWNQYMPKIPTTNTIRMVHFTDDDWNIPSESYVKALEDKKVTHPLGEGRLTAKPK